MKETIEMQSDSAALTLGEHATGTIEPTEQQQERLDEQHERLQSGEFHIETKFTIPCACIDGRCGCVPRPDSAGGSETIMVADDLTTKRFAAEDGTTRGAYRNTLDFLRRNGLPIGGHDDNGDHTTDGKSGCGANDRLEDIYRVLATKPEVVRAIASQLGVVADESDHNLIVQNAEGRREFSRGRELLDDLSNCDKDCIDHLEGTHNETVIVINTRYGTTLDRDKLAAEFGDKYQAFNVDVWAFEEAARLTSETDAEARAKGLAMVYYNIATALTLCGPNIRIVTVE